MEKEFSQSSDSSTEIEENQKSKPLVFGIVSKMSASASRLLGALKGKVRVTGIENNVKVNNDLIERYYIYYILHTVCIAFLKYNFL